MKHKIGLVLEGGGMRGMYTGGVTDVMLDKGFEPDIICGTSAGTTFGINMVSKQRGRALRYNKRFAGHKEYISLHSWIHTGNMINKEFAYDLLPRELDPFDEETFEKSHTKFYSTITNVQTGQAEYIQLTDCYKQMDVIRASASLPIICEKVHWNGNDYLDGGLVDNIPLDKCIELGCDKIIVVLTHPLGYVKNDHITLACRLWYPHDKQLNQAIKRRNANYQKRLKQIREMELAGQIVVLRPSKLIKVGRLESDPDRMQALYDLGIADTLKLWDTITEYLAKD